MILQYIAYFCYLIPQQRKNSTTRVCIQIDHNPTVNAFSISLKIFLRHPISILTNEKRTRCGGEKKMQNTHVLCRPHRATTNVVAFFFLFPSHRTLSTFNNIRQPFVQNEPATSKATNVPVPYCTLIDQHTEESKKDVFPFSVAATTSNNTCNQNKKKRKRETHSFFSSSFVCFQDEKTKRKNNKIANRTKSTKSFCVFQQTHSDKQGVYKKEGERTLH